jgi:ABC-2 type transport system ATP-binding protein
LGNSPDLNSAPMIQVENLSKTYRVPTRPPGFLAAMRALVRRAYEDIDAVCDVNFVINPGEVVGFIGPNGAGKTTTLKMLAGLLHPSAGRAIVAGFTPWERRPAFLQQISMVLGNKSQMIWDIPALDTYHVLGEIYHLPPAVFQKTLDELVTLLEMEDLLNKPVRNLSLGERMKCELAAGLIHRPSILFLDEPTLGLDVSMQNRLRRFIADYNRQSGATIILTSHYMADVTALCERVLLIHHGRLRYDGGLAALAERLTPFKMIRVTLEGENGVAPLEVDLPGGVELRERDGNHLTLRVARSAAPELTARLLAVLPVNDLSVEDPPIEAVIDQVYREDVL